MPTEIALARLREQVAAGAQLVEVLPSESYAKAHLPGAINLPLGSRGRTWSGPRPPRANRKFSVPQNLPANHPLGGA
jgi:rhodanese-related sulfurtransferase